MSPKDPAADLVVEDRFAIVPEWLLDADIGDAAVRLYAVLLRYGNSSGTRMPSRSTLARRLRKRSSDSVDRAMKELVTIGAVRVEHRYDGAQRLTNAYHVRTSRPTARNSPAPPNAGVSRISAATRSQQAGGGRRGAARVAADPGHDPEHLTESTSCPGTTKQATESGHAVAEAVAAACGIGDWPAFVAEVQALRRQLNAPVTRWVAPSLAAALQLATRGRNWPTDQAAAALLRVAADPQTRSPMRLAEAGPWWDEVPPAGPDGDIAAMEQALLEAGGARVDLQVQARRDLERQGMPVTRVGVIRGAFRLLNERSETGGAA